MQVRLDTVGIMNELNSLVSKIPLLPDWAKSLTLHLLGIYIVLQLVHLILKKLQTPEMRNAIASLKELSGDALRRAGRSLELPVKRPRLALVSSTLNTILLYMFSLIYFAWFGVFLMLSSTTQDIALYKRLLSFGVTGALLIAARWYYASAERERIALNESWKSLREKK